MRILERDKQTIYFQNFMGKTEKTEVVNGKTIRLGEYELTYGDKTSALVYVSPPKGTRQAGMGKATLEPIGVVEKYQRTIISEEPLGITEESLVWVDSETEPDYKVVLIGHSYHHSTYIIIKL